MPPVSQAPRERFPIYNRVRRWAGRALIKWLERHQHPVSFALHLVGIPMTLVGLALLAFLPWWWGAGTFVLGYALQFLGHAIEGNDVGELIPIKRLLGLRTVPISPKYRPFAEAAKPAT